MTVQHDDEVRAAVREHYGKAAEQAGSGSSCCAQPLEVSPIFGSALYDIGERTELPEQAVLASLGCGNPTALAALEPGEVVLDLGSGGGIDVLLSARRVGPTGKAYGLDMTPQMHELAQRNQAEAGVTNAEFLIGSIEDVPLPDSSVDVIISNCVVNLSPDKPAVVREAFRVLRPGGRLAISDIVTLRPLPPEVADVTSLWTGCVSGAMPESMLRDELVAAGFLDVDIELVNVYSRADLEAMAGDVDPARLPAGTDPEGTLEALDGAVASAFIRARKPA